MTKATKRKRTIGAPQARSAYLSADERAAKGKALRDAVPRASQAGWTPPKGRRDPVELTLASNEGRMVQLLPIRHGRMSASPFAFYRGSAALMAADLATTPTSGIRVQACGDAHLMNFGGFATPERNVIFDINDLDETLPAPFEWDLKRLAASVVIAAQHLEFANSDAASIAMDVVREYRIRMGNYATMRALDVWYDRIDLQRYEDRTADPEMLALIRKRVAERIEAEKRKSAPEHLFPKLVSHEGARPMIKDEPPLIFHPSEELAPGLKSGYAEAIAAYRETLPPHVRVLFDRFRFHDLAVKVVGVGSVGTYLPDRIVHGRGQRPAVPAGQGGARLGARAVCGQERVSESRPAGRRGAAADADGERRLPRMDAREERARCLRSTASRHEGVRDHRGLGHEDVAAIRPHVRACPGPRARPLR